MSALLLFMSLASEPAPENYPIRDIAPAVALPHDSAHDWPVAAPHDASHPHLWPVVRTGWGGRPHFGAKDTYTHNASTWRCGPGASAHDVTCHYCDMLLNTRKYDSRCHQGGLRPTLRLLVTGCGGTGTNTIKGLFGQRGVSIGHEKFGSPDGVVGWPEAVSDWYVRRAYPYSGHDSVMKPQKPLFRYVAHVVRCPLANIEAMATHSATTHEFLHAAGVPLPHGHPTAGLNDRLAFGAFWWIMWNSHVGQYADYTFQTESMNDEGLLHVDTILWRAGFNVSAPSVRAQPVPQKNQREHGHNLTLHQLERAVNYSQYAPGLGPGAGRQVVERITRMAKSYGFGSECLV